MSNFVQSTKTNRGNFFENFRIGQEIIHATPRTITPGDVALYTGLYGSRFAVQSSDVFAQAIGIANAQPLVAGCAPVDDLIVFHIVFGKTVPDISLNAVANLGYAECRFLKLVYPGDTLSARSEVIGLKENSNGETGVVYVRTTGRNQHGEIVLTYVRWVMVKKSQRDAPTQPTVVPTLETQVAPSDLGQALPKITVAGYQSALSGSPYLFGDYTAGECIDHVEGVTIEEAEHQLATRLYQNTAKVHFDNFAARETRFGKRLIYGGIAISLARALTFNGLGNAFRIAAINGGRHVAPLFAGDTVYAWSEVLEVADVGSRKDVGALRLRTVATKNLPCAAFPYRNPAKDPAEGVILDLDYWVLLPR
jgi:2-methylfumaryl-CoA hydratase